MYRLIETKVRRHMAADGRTVDMILVFVDFIGVRARG